MWMERSPSAEPAARGVWWQCQGLRFKVDVAAGFDTSRVGLCRCIVTLEADAW